MPVGSGGRSMPRSRPPRREFVEALNEIDERISGRSYRGHRARYLARPWYERDLYDVNRFNFECVLGGLGTFFTNTAGGHWRETIDALGRIGAKKAQRMLASACELFPRGQPPARRGALERQANDKTLQRKLAELAGDFDDGEVQTAMEAYWRKHSRQRRNRG